MAYGHSSSILLEITLKDFAGGKLDFFRCDNNGDFKKILNLLKSKYGYGVED
jgi:hypothetical protein